MTTEHPPTSFPTLAAIGALTLTALAIGLVAWLVAPAVFGRSVAVEHAVLFAGALAWLASILGLVPVVMLSPWGLMPTVYGYFIGTGLRLILCLVAANIAVHAFHFPGAATAICLGSFYMLLLFVEIAFVGRHLWRVDAFKGSGGSREVMA